MKKWRKTAFCSALPRTHSVLGFRRMDEEGRTWQWACSDRALTCIREWTERKWTALNIGVNAPKTHWGQISDLIVRPHLTTFLHQWWALKGHAVSWRPLRNNRKKPVQQLSYRTGEVLTKQTRRQTKKAKRFNHTGKLVHRWAITQAKASRRLTMRRS